MTDQTDDDWLEAPEETVEDMSWLEADSVEQTVTGLDNRAQIMRSGAQEGRDRVWWTDGEYIWFRRARANPATLERHEKFCQTGDYRYVETQGDVEVYQLQPSSPFKTKDEKQIDIGMMDNYNVRRQAVLAACRRDWPAFKDIMTFLRERISAVNANPNTPGTVSPLAENIYAEQYLAVMASIEQRDGPSPGEINREIMALTHRTGANRQKLITIGRGA